MPPHRKYHRTQKIEDGGLRIEDRRVPFSILYPLSSILGLLFLLAAIPVLAQNNRPVPGVYRGSQQCIGCHSETLGVTAHLKTMEGPEGILTTTIDGQTVSVFDPRTPGYDKFVRPYE